MRDNLFANFNRSLYLGYRPSIDGLRSIAVVSVLLVHFNKEWLSGGFVGVDVFFVISGYLLTAILLKEIQLKKFSIIWFYQRRIARIFPAFFVVILVTFAIGSIVYSAQDLASLGANTAAAAVSLINIKLLHQGTYFQISGDAQPILHYWSLAVEEQFYFIFPIYLYVITRFKNYAIVNLIIFNVSFAACVAVSYYDANYSFYLLPTRAWEMLAGSSLAIFELQRIRFSHQTAAAVSWSGAVLLVLSLFAIDQSYNYPGWIAVLPVLATVLLLSAASYENLFVTRVLSISPVVLIGRLSYSLYLWHWPTFSLIDYQFFQESDFFRGALKVAITIAASIATYSLVEKPLRAFIGKPAMRSFAFAGLIVAVTVLCAIGIFERNSNYLNATPAQIAAGGNLIVGGSKGKIVLVGDSQASMYGKDLVSLTRALGLILNILSVDAGNELPQEPATHWPEVYSFIKQDRPDIVIMANAWSEKIGNNPEPLRQALKDLKGHVRHVILLTQQPFPPESASREGIRNGAKAPFFEKPSDRAKRMQSTAIVESFSSDWVAVIDVNSLFLGPNNEIQLFGKNGRLTFQDANHLSDTGTAIVRSLLERAIDRAL